MSKLLQKTKNAGTELVLLAIIIVFGVGLSIFTNSFLTAYNLTNLARQASITGIVAIGMTFVIISGGIDLSVGSVAGFSGILAATLMTEQNLPPALAILITMGCAMLIGLVNSIIITEGHVVPFICTLGMQQAVRGLTLLLCNAKIVSGVPESFGSFATKSFLGIPSLLLVWLVVVVVFAYMAKFTRTGRYIYSVGSNEESSRLSGIRVRYVRYFTYITSALLASIAGILMTARMGSGQPQLGVGYETDAIAAAVLGGTSFLGGEGGVVGTILGTLIMVMIKNGGNLLKINSFVLDILAGSILIAGVLVDQMRKKRQ